MKVETRVLGLLLVMMSLLALAACGGGCPTNSLGSSGGSGGTSGGFSTGGTVCGPGNSGGSSATALVYFADDNAGVIKGASLSATNTLALITNFQSPTFTPDFDAGMVVANGKFLYVPLFNATSVLAYSINSTTGALTPISGSPFLVTGASSATSIATDPAGRFLFVGDDFSSNIWVFQIGSDGSLTLNTASPFNQFNLDFPDFMAVDGTGNLLYVAQGNGGQNIAGFFIDQNTGSLTSIPGSPFAFPVAQIRTEATGKFLYGVTGNAGVGGGTVDNHVYGFAINAGGFLTPLAGSPFTTVSAPFNLMTHPSGKFLYTFNESTAGLVDPIEGYAIDSSSGALTALAGSPFTTLPTLDFCQFDQGGTHSICVPAFTVLDVNTSTGALSHTATDLTVSPTFPSFAVTD